MPHTQHLHPLPAWVLKWCNTPQKQSNSSITHINNQWFRKHWLFLMWLNCNLGKVNLKTMLAGQCLSARQAGLCRVVAWSAGADKWLHMSALLCFAFLCWSLPFTAYDTGVRGVLKVVGARLVAMVTSKTMLPFHTTCIGPSTFKAPAPKLIFLISTTVKSHCHSPYVMVVLEAEFL